MIQSRRPLVETLEARRLLAASPLPDLTITFFSPYAQVRSGTRTFLNANVSNVGNATAKGKVVIRLTGDGATLANNVVSLRLKPGDVKTFIIRFLLPDSRNASLGKVYTGGPTGVPVDLALTVDAKNKTAEQDETNNTVTENQVPVWSLAYWKTVPVGVNPGGGGGWWWF